jgi:hypothetical protein
MPTKTPFIVAKHTPAAAPAPTPQIVSNATCAAILQRADITGHVDNPDRLKFAENVGKLIGAATQIHVFDADTVNTEGLHRKSVARGFVDVIGMQPTKGSPGIVGCIERYK